MTWIDTRLAALEALKERNAIVRSHAEAIYEAPWGRIVEHLDEAKEKNSPVSTNGALHKRLIVLRKQNKSGNSFELELVLLTAKDRITASSSREGGLVLDLDIYPDGVVCMKIGGRTVSIHEAAILILDPFLFPQLQG